MSKVTLQIQTVVYKNEKYSLLRALEALANAVRVNRSTSGDLSDVMVCYGDASPEPVFSEDEVAQMSVRYGTYFEFKYVFFGENTGTSRGHNRLGLACDKDLILVMNPDVILSPRFFAPMIETLLDETKNAGIAEARQTPVEHPKEYDKETLETTWATGACFMVSSETYRRLGGFDEDTFFLYCDDVDFSWRLRLLGKKIYYRPDCVAFHSKSLTSAGRWTPTEAEEYYSREAALLMAYKWSDDKRTAKIYEQFKGSPARCEQMAAESFDKRRAEGRLPERLDPKGEISDFSSEIFTRYSKHRYEL